MKQKARADARGTYLQFEISRKWWDSLNHQQRAFTEDGIQRLYSMASTAACDTIRNGGTFVLVANGDKLTMVQRPTVEDLDAPDEQSP